MNGNFNPLETLDNILADYASEKTRRLIHSLIALAGVLVTIWLAADGDWTAFALALGGTLYAAANKANTPAVELTPPGVDDPHGSDDDGLTYEESGGGEIPDEAVLEDTPTEGQ